MTRLQAKALAQRVAALEALLVEPPPPPPTDLLAGQMAPSLRAIARAVCAEWQIGLPALLSPRRAPALVEARHAAMWLARRLTDSSLPQIGRAFRRDHTTVLHGVDRMRQRLAADAALAARVDRAAVASCSLPPNGEG